MSDEDRNQTEAHDGLLESVERARRRERERRENEPSLARFIGQIGMLGWMVVIPTLIGLFIGRFIDQRLGSGIFWSAPLLLIGVVIGYWSAWKWMHRQ